MTKTQKRLLKMLRDGGWIWVDFCGIWRSRPTIRYNARKIQLATQVALEATGELVEIQFDVSMCLSTGRICHIDHVSSVAAGRAILLLPLGDETMTTATQKTTGEILPWAKDAKLIRSQETNQFVIDLDDDQTREDWLTWGRENDAI